MRNLPGARQRLDFIYKRISIACIHFSFSPTLHFPFRHIKGAAISYEGLGSHTQRGKGGGCGALSFSETTATTSWTFITLRGSSPRSRTHYLISTVPSFTSLAIISSLTSTCSFTLLSVAPLAVIPRSTGRMEDDGGSSLHTAPGEAQMKFAFQDFVMEEVLYYAYQNNLITDHRLSSFSIVHLFGELIQGTIPSTEEDGFTDCSHLAEFEVPTPLPLDNTLQVTPSAMRLICDARQVLSDDEAHQLTEQVCNAASVRSMKLELPILRTDNDWDMGQYHRENAARQPALLESIKKHTLPLDEPDVDKGEGMELSPKVRSECEAMMKNFEEERLAVTKDNLTYLVGQIKDEYTQEDRMEYLVGEIKYDKASVFRASFHLI